MIRTKNNRVRSDFSGKGEIFEFKYSIDREVEKKRAEKELEKMAARVGCSLNNRYSFIRDESVQLECLDELFDLIAVQTKITHFDECGNEIYTKALTDEERNNALKTMFERVKRGLELVTEEEAKETELIEHLNAEQAKTK